MNFNKLIKQKSNKKINDLKAIDNKAITQHTLFS